MFTYVADRSAKYVRYGLHRYVSQFIVILDFMVAVFTEMVIENRFLGIRNGSAGLRLANDN